MGKAKQCDRCKKLYVPEAAKEHFKLQRLDGRSNRYTRYTHAIDLCPECNKSLKEWLEGAADEN